MVIIAGGAVNNVRVVDGGGVVARTGVDIRTAKDFEGKRVGVPGIGAYMHVLFRRWLSGHGADYRKVNFVEVPLAQGSDILKSGNVDAMLLGEPFYNRVITAKTGYLVVALCHARCRTACSRSIIRPHAPGRRTMRRPSSVPRIPGRGGRCSRRDPGLARQILGRVTRLPPDVIAAMSLPTLRLPVPRSDVRYWSDSLLAQGMIKSRPANPDLAWSSILTVSGPEPPREAPLIAFEKVSLSLGGRPILQDIDLDVRPREFICVVGPSGCGKTTLLRLIAGLVHPERARSPTRAAAVGEPSGDVAMIFQDYSKALLPGARRRQRVAGVRGQAVRRRRCAPGASRRLLETVGLAHHADKYPVQLSGGMQQRLQIARCLAQDPPCC